MFKTDLGLITTCKRLIKDEGFTFCARGLAANTTAVAVPIAMTIFLTDLFISNKHLFSIRQKEL